MYYLNGISGNSQNTVVIKNVMQGKLIEVAYTLRTY